MTEGKVITAAHLLGVHTTEVIVGYNEWRTWCAKEGVDPEVMTFDAWLKEMEAIDRGTE